MKRLALVVLGVVALAPPKASAHPIRIELGNSRNVAAETAEGNAQLVAAIKARNAGAVAKQLRAPLDHGGLWFPDAGCTKRFGKPGIVNAKELDAFARCVATVELITSTRVSAQPTDTVLTYKPGVELEVGFLRGKVYSFGRDHTIPDATPMLTAQAFEALRKTGATNLDSQLAKLERRPSQQPRSVSLWIRICLDANGAVTASAPTGGTDFLFREQIADWTFRPFEVRGVATPACSQSLLTYPAAAAPSVETLPAQAVTSSSDNADLDDEGEIDIDLTIAPQNIPPTVMDGLRLNGTKTIPPDAATTAEIVKLGKLRVIGSFKVCIGITGLVTTVSTLKSTGFPLYDGKLVSEMRAWRFKPYLVNRKPIAACTAETFIYKP
jgi:hypothetical protein